MLQPKLVRVEAIFPLTLRLYYETGEVKLFGVTPYATGSLKWSRVISVYSGVLRRGRRANRYRKHSRKKKVCIE